MRKNMKKKIIGFFVCTLVIFTVFTPNTTSLEPEVIMDNDGCCSCMWGTISTIDFIEPDVSICNSVVDDLPSTWDWRDVNGEDWTTPIRDQNQDACGSCWAFGALGGLESNYKIWMNDPSLDIDLSEQYILSCSSGSCDGWYLSSTLSWVKHNGIISEDCMPYEADDTVPCESKCVDWRDQLFGINDYKRLSREDVNAIQEALIDYGPLPATMEVYGDFYPEWSGGVYQYITGEFVFGHVITIVGFDDTWGNENEGYWICKNSWGTEWGEDGWFRIAYGECKIEDSVYYIEGLNYPPEKPEKPTGTSTGEPGVEYTFTSSCIDPDDNKLYYQFAWGDGNDSGWMGPYESGETVSANYTWKSKGTYPVKVKTMDFIGPDIYDYGMESEWSDPLSVSMLKSKPYINTPFLDFLQNHPILYQLLLRFLQL